MRKDLKKAREMEVEMMEGALLQIFERDTPDIYKVREILMRLSRTQKQPNQGVVGDWIIFWASREGCVDRLWGTGMTSEGWWLPPIMEEFLLQFGTKKDGRTMAGAEILRKVGPFPNQSNSLKGTYAVAGTNRLVITWTEMKTDDGKEVRFKDKEGANAEEKVVDIDVIYSSPKMVVLQEEDANGECDFYVLTPVENLQSEVDRLVGTTRAKTFFN